MTRMKTLNINHNVTKEGSLECPPEGLYCYQISRHGSPAVNLTYVFDILHAALAYHLPTEEYLFRFHGPEIGRFNS